MFYASQVMCYNQKNIKWLYNDKHFKYMPNDQGKENLGEQDQTLFTSSIKEIKNFEVCL